MMWLRKSKKGFTLIELMVVVAIIGVLALLGLRLYTGQQDKAKNAIVKANAGTVHTLIQANLADASYATALLAVNSIGNAVTGGLLTDGDGINSERPAGMKNPHLTADVDFVVKSIDGDYASSALFVTAAETLGALYKGAVIVGDSNLANKFFVVPLDKDAKAIGEVYIAQK